MFSHEMYKPKGPRGPEHVVILVKKYGGKILGDGTISNTLVVFLLTVPRQFLCSSFSFFLCTPAVTYVVHVLSLFVHYLSFLWCLWRAYFVAAAFPGYSHFYFDTPRIFPPYFTILYCILLQLCV